MKKKVAKKKVSVQSASTKRRRRRVVPEAVATGISHRFDYVENPTSEQVDTCVELRAAHKNLAMLVGRSTPICREQSIALTKLEEALFYATAATVRPNGGDNNG